MINIKKIYFLFAIILILFGFNITVKAECSYEERKELLQEAKNVEANIEYNTLTNSFDFKIYNLTQNLYAEINDSQDTKTISGKDLLNGTYNFNTTNTERAVTYSLKIYSGSIGCYGKLLTSKRVKKGVVNKFSFDNSCKGIEEYYYCKTILDTPITISDEMVYKNIENYKKSLESNSDNDEEFNISNFANKYWYIGLILIIIIVIIVIILLLRKRQSKLM